MFVTKVLDNKHLTFNNGKRDYYEVLGVSKDASEDEIKGI